MRTTTRQGLKFPRPVPKSKVRCSIAASAIGVRLAVRRSSNNKRSEPSLGRWALLPYGEKAGFAAAKAARNDAAERRALLRGWRFDIRYRKMLYARSCGHCARGGGAGEMPRLVIRSSAACHNGRPADGWDMFNNGLKSKLDAVCHELARTPPRPRQWVAVEIVRPSRSASRRAPQADWWPVDLGTPSSVGAQNDLRYAVFP